MSYGLRKENGKLMGYKTPQYAVHKEQFAERELKAKITREQIKRAERALEIWATWLHDCSNGYGSSSADIREADRLPAESRPPYGVEMPKVVAEVIQVFKKMEEINATHKNYVYVIKTVCLARKQNKSIKEILEGKEVASIKQFRIARRRFCQLFNSL